MGQGTGIFIPLQFAGVVKLANTLRSGRSARKGLEVQVLSPAQFFYCGTFNFVFPQI